MLDSHSAQVGFVRAFAENKTPRGQIESLLWSGWHVCHSSEWQRASAVEQELCILVTPIWRSAASGFGFSDTVLIRIHSSILSRIHLLSNCFLEHQLCTLQTVLAVWPLVPTYPYWYSPVGKTDRRTQIAQRMNLLKWISHNDNKLYEEDILGALIGRRSQPREREDYKAVWRHVLWRRWSRVLWEREGCLKTNLPRWGTRETQRKDITEVEHWWADSFYH